MITPGRFLRILLSRPRLLAAALLMVAALILLPTAQLSTRFILAYGLGVTVWLVLIAVMFLKSDNAGMQRRADEEDAGAFLVLLFGTLASLASLVAIGAELHGLKEAGAPIAVGRVALVGYTILVSWLFVHTNFAIHYAHDFYAGEDDRRGLEFPGEEQPDYWDFLYFAFNMGAAAQTSDVVVKAARTRRLVLAHTVLSFLFNTTILALAINVGAGLL